MTSISRRECLRILALGAVPAALAAKPWSALWAAPCGALDGTTITWIVPNASGGGYDSASRLIAPHYARALSARIAIRNVPGAGGLVGARTIVRSKPDGRTIGMINASGLLAASLAGEKNAPNPATEFTVLARVVGSRQIWATGATSPHHTIEDVFAAARERAIVFGTRDVGSVGFVNMTLVSEVLGLPIEVVAGYEGSGAGALATTRGEVDLVAYNFESIVGQVESGDVRPILQIASSPISAHESLAGVPLVGGHDGIAARRARERARPIEPAIEDAETVIDLVGAGRLVVGPKGMGGALSACMEEALLRTLGDPAFQELARRAQLSLDVAGGEEARARLLTVSGRAAKFVPVLERAVRKLRG